jgi:hypothetical protein
MKYTGHHRYHPFLTIIHRRPDAFDTGYRLTFRWERNMRNWFVLTGLVFVSAVIFVMAVIGVVTTLGWLWK